VDSLAGERQAVKLHKEICNRSGVDAVWLLIFVTLDCVATFYSAENCNNILIHKLHKFSQIIFFYICKVNRIVGVIGVTNIKNCSKTFLQKNARLDL